MIHILTKIKNRLFRFRLNKTKSKYLKFKIYHHQDDSLLLEIEKSKEGIYEKHETDVILKVLENIQNPVMLDIGANIGLMTLNVCAFVNEISIHAFEPGPSQFSLLNKNIDYNKLNNKVKIYNIALSSMNGEIDFYIHENKHSSGDGLRDTGRAGNVSVIKIPTMTLDTWWRNLAKPNVDFVKIDTEGSELLVLKGAKEFIKQCQPIILIEICYLNYEKYGDTYTDYLHLLNELGYDLYDLDKKNIITTQNHELFKNQFYYLAINSSKHN